MVWYKHKDGTSLSTPSVVSVSTSLNGSYRRHSTNEQLPNPSVALRRVSSFTSANTLSHRSGFPLAEKFTGKKIIFIISYESVNKIMQSHYSQ